MRKKFQLPLLTLLILCLNGLIYVRASITIAEVNLVFAECARNSGRTSAALNLALLFLLCYYGFKAIYRNEQKRQLFRMLITLFAVNHLVHFYFVSQNFKSQLMELSIADNIHGFITFICLLTAPIVLWSAKRLNKWVYFGIILHLFNVTYFISDTFYGRFNPEDPAYLHRLGVLLMALTLIVVLFRMYKERSVSFDLDSTE